MLLPYMEQQPLFNAANFNWTCWWGYGNTANSTVFWSRISSFICPSDGPRTSTWGEPMRNNYHWSFGTTTSPWSWETIDTTGAMAVWKSYSESAFTDGTSNTILLSEALVGFDRYPTKWRTGMTISPLGGASLYDPIVIVGGQMQLAAPVVTALNACDNTYRTGAGGARTWNRGNYWGTGSPGLSMFNTVVTPNSNQYQWSACRIDCVGCGIDFGNFHNASANHSGGVNVAMADGSVRFIKSSITPQAWWSIGTKAGGEAVSSDQF
jgi:prepilin-type processing-associated H-X9-DG protein